MQFELPNHYQASLVEVIDSLRIDEQTVISELLKDSVWAQESDEAYQNLAAEWVSDLRAKRLNGLSLDAFFQQYKLSSAEGLALMCLAESLMRIPDAKNIDALITDKISDQDWLSQVGQSSSKWINASSFGLAVGGKVMRKQDSAGALIKLVAGLAKRLGSPILRQSIRQCMGILGKQFVMGETIEAALKRSYDSEKYFYSFDMLGEAAKTYLDAEHYFQQYLGAINHISKSGKLSDNILKNPSISVKISALHPRYEWTSSNHCFDDLLSKLRELVLAAKAANIGLTLDAEESDRLAFSLKIFRAIFQMPELAGWSGLGLAIQAYLRATGKTIDFLINLAKSEGKKIPVRLVKGAYWDTEIKDSQVRGLSDYPVFTRKVSTDAHYLLCAEKLVAAAEHIYPQFASHNAFTIAKIFKKLQSQNIEYEFQCLHGMGQTLYDDIIEKYPSISCRNYAPVGKHAELLPYLVRRLLENGANTSFVNQILDENIPVASLVKSPFTLWAELACVRNTAIPLPNSLFGESRRNSKGLNIQDFQEMSGLVNQMQAYKFKNKVGVAKQADCVRDVHAPSELEQVLCQANFASAEHVVTAYQQAADAYKIWHQTDVSYRASILRKAADLLEESSAEVMAICIAEAGKTYQDAIDEVREAVDFLRYYASLAEESLAKRVCPGPTGEHNSWQPLGRGVVLCISPWNFPLAIFLGQVSAALVAGNAVIAKPASQTIAVADWAVDILYKAGIPRELLHLLPGRREIVGHELLNNKHLSAVMLTGSTATGKAMAKTLADRPGEIVPLVAETGGQNAMIVDSTALPEQVVQDIVDSAFKSAGQRCSALRVLYIQDEIFDKVQLMLAGAMESLRVGDSRFLETDVGPLIDGAALKRMQEHESFLLSLGAKEIAKCSLPSLNGHYFAPVAYEIDSISQLPGEVFGPILHVIRYSSQNLDKCLAEINATEFGLTLGIHSRLESTVAYICKNVRVGNIYVNRNMVGAVVGVQPFGGEGLSGTGPKAGGPWYLTKLCREQTVSVNTTAVGGNAQLMTMKDENFTGFDLT